MWGEDHEELTHAALNALVAHSYYPLPQSFLDGVMQGVIAANNEWNTFHHDYSRDSIKLLLAKAKALYRKRDYWNAGYYAGKAVHYLQDRCFGGLAVGVRHKEVEGYFRGVPLYPEYAEYGIKDAKDSFEDVEKVVNFAEKTTFHHSIMKKALYVTGFVLASITKIGEKDKKTLRLKLALRGAFFVFWLSFAAIITLWAVSILKNVRTEYDYTAVFALLSWLPVKGAFARFWGFRRWYSGMP